ncbi:hypothetical protein G5714_013273 [Onychostoma macrolepis]|uniref:Uncharacterized protein n=1 Tax=Onychostoma macrolepis TaxID=369639 RepID=A0A7J6CES3_9TELE|nr:hypothetical protein G5714_013273 [Onychostoma macrolepis]
MCGGRLLGHVKLRALQILLKWQDKDFCSNQMRVENTQIDSQQPFFWLTGANPPAKGYLELGGKGEGELQTSREAEEEEDTDGDEVVELLNVSDSEGSLRSQYLD